MNFIKVLSCSIISLIIVGCASTGAPIAKYSTPMKALVVLDMQKDFLSANAKLPIQEDSKGPLIDAVNRATANAAKNQTLVIYIRTVFPPSDIINVFRNNAAIKGTPGSEIDNRVAIVSDIIFEKNQTDAFSNLEFEKFLIAHQVDELAITGVFADQCCYFTSIAALNRNYRVVYLIDGVGAGTKESIRNAADSLVKKGAIITTIEGWER